MQRIVVSIPDSCYAALDTVAGKHGMSKEELASEIILRHLEGEDCRQELRRLRDDISILAQAILTVTKTADQETARLWVNEQLRLHH